MTKLVENRMIIQFGEENEALLTTIKITQENDSKKQISFMTLFSDIKVKFVSENGETLDEFYITDCNVTIEKKGYQYG